MPPSCFIRNARAYDTLLQMGRWFGYREGYDDLCRLWLTAEAEGWYRHVTGATGELKRDFARMRRRQATPSEFGLRVRTHPGTLLITARNKMASGMDVTDATWDISLTGRGIETARLFADAKRNRQNFQSVNRLAGQLVAAQGMPIPSPHTGAVLWRDVAAETVADFVDAFAIHPLDNDFQGDSIAEFLRRFSGEKNAMLGSWIVVLRTTGLGPPEPLASLPDRKVHTLERKVQKKPQEGSLLVSAKSARVGDPRDVRHGLSIESARQVEEKYRSRYPDAKRVPEDEFRADMPSPLLILYLLRGIEGKREPKKYYHDDLVLPALAMHFPGKRQDSEPARQLVRYRLNRVAQAGLIPMDLDDDSAADDLDPDD